MPPSVVLRAAIVTDAHELAKHSLNVHYMCDLCRKFHSGVRSLNEVCCPRSSPHIILLVPLPKIGTARLLRFTIQCSSMQTTTDTKLAVCSKPFPCRNAEIKVIDHPLRLSYSVL